jgi:hypothetical protein
MVDGIDRRAWTGARWRAAHDRRTRREAAGGAPSVHRNPEGAHQYVLSGRLKTTFGLYVWLHAGRPPDRHGVDQRGRLAGELGLHL